MKTSRSIVLAACLVLLLASLAGCVTRSPAVAPITVGFPIESTDLTERLAREVNGLKAYQRVNWQATYERGNDFKANLAWGKHELTVLVKVDERAQRVDIQYLASKNLNETNAKHIHKMGVKQIRSLHKKIRGRLAKDARYYARGKPITVGGIPRPVVANVPRPAPAPAPVQRAQPRYQPQQYVAPAPAPPPSGDVLAGLDPGRYHALVIGNNSYANLPKLRTAVADAAMVASVLELEYGFDVQLITDGSRRDIVSALNGYRRRLDDSENLLIFYAGHGWYDDDAERGYWLPVDSAEGDPSNWISNATITDMVRAIPAKHVMIVADSCYSGTLTRGIKMQNTSGSSSYLRKMIEKKARTAMTSGGLEPVEDGSGKHSVFASAFTDALRANPGQIDAQTLFANIRRPVMVGADQTPEYGDIRRAGHEGGDFLFVRRR